MTSENLKKEPTSKRQIGRKTFLKFSSTSLISFFGLITLIFVKRSPDFGYEAVGMLAFAAAYVSLFQIIGDFGFGIAHTKHVNDKDLDKGKCNATLIIIKSFLSVIMILVILSFFFISKFIFDYSFESKTLELVLSLTIIKLFFDNIVSIFKNIYSANLEIATVAIPRTIGRFVQALLKISVVLMGFSIFHLIGAEIVASLLILIMLIYLFRGNPVKKPDWKYFKIYISFALPAIFIGVLAIFTENFDKVMLQFFIGSEEVGIYVIPQRLISFFAVIPLILFSTLLPTFSEFYSDGKFGKMASLSNASVKHISMILVPLTVFCFIFANPFLVLLFGDDATKSTTVFQMLMVAMYINSIFIPYSVQIISSGHLMVAFIINLATLVLNLVLNMIFIPNEIFGIQMLGLGAPGAALTTLISLTLRGLLIKYYAFKITKTGAYWPIWKHFLGGLIAAICGVFLYEYSTWYLLVPFCMFITIVYLGVLYILREFGREEFEFFMNTINPLKMKSYISGELKR